MTRAPGTVAIACTSCGAGLSILGGGRVVTRVCEYCGAALDANEGWRVLARHDRAARPASPLHLGVTGDVEGEPFTVIGTLGRVERWAGREWRWAEHQIHSPLRGYARLSVEDGHAILTRRHRGGTEPSWISARDVEQAEARPSARLRGDRRRFVYHETTTAETDFVEGAFTFEPAPGDRSTTVVLRRDDEALSFTEGETEREVTSSRYLPQAETWASFGVEPPPVTAVHALQPHAPWRHERFVTRAAGAFAAASLAAFAVLSGEPGRQVLADVEIAVAQLPQTLEFDAPGSERPTRVALQSDLRNAWAVFEVGVEGPDGAPLLALARVTEAYSGRDSDGRWSEGDDAPPPPSRPRRRGPTASPSRSPRRVSGTAAARSSPRPGCGRRSMRGWPRSSSARWRSSPSCPGSCTAAPGGTCPTGATNDALPRPARRLMLFRAAFLVACAAVLGGAVYLLWTGVGAVDRDAARSVRAGSPGAGPGGVVFVPGRVK